MSRDISAGYVSTWIILLLITSLGTHGFADILYISAMGMNSLPLLVTIINFFGGLVYLYGMILFFIRSDYDEWWYAIVHYIIIILLVFTPYVGVFLMLGGVILIAFASDEEEFNAPLAGLFVILLVVVGIIMLYSPIAGSSHIKAEMIKSPIDVYGVYRLIPLYTAHVYAEDRIQSPIHTVFREDSYLYYVERGGKYIPVYNWIIEPEGAINEFTKKPKGLILVEGDRFPPNVTVVNKPLKYGLHKRYFYGVYVDDIYRRCELLVLGNKVLFDENIEKVYNNKVYIIIPFIGWERGMLYSIPKPRGFIVVDENGNFQLYSIDEAKKNPLFRGVPLIPEYVARKWAEIYNYHTGFWDYYFRHNRYAIRDVGENKQPYLTVDDNGTLYWTFVVEPEGKTYSVKYIIYINTSTVPQKPKLMFYKPNTTMIGVSKVESYVLSKHPNYDWNRLKVVEPIPTILNGTIYWKVTIISKDYRGLVAVDLVDARTSRITTIDVSKYKTITGDEILNLLSPSNVSAPTHIGGNMTIIQQIEELKQEINQTINKLNTLYQQLNELEEKLANQTNATQSGG
jgi:hypothetical protein